MKKGKIISLAIVIIVILLVIIFIPRGAKISGLSEEAKQAFTKDFETEDIKFNKIVFKDDSITVGYVQDSDFEMNDLFSNWAYIMIVAVKNSSADSVIVECEFDSGGEIKSSASAQDIISFNEDQISVEEFFSKIQVEVVKSGPVIQASD